MPCKSKNSLYLCYSVIINRKMDIKDLNIPVSGKKRVVVIGGGFAGIKLVRELDSRKFQTVLIDKNNYHQFQPLIYQVASSGLEPASICFPLRRVFAKKKDFFFRVAEVLEIDGTGKTVRTSEGDLSYDYLVVCAGAVTNFYGNANIEKAAIPMKTVEDAIYLRNKIIEISERSLLVSDEKLEPYCNLVIVGGGPTGVEIAGVLSEMIRYATVQNAEYDPEKYAKIILISPDILKTMSSHASSKTREALEKMGVHIISGRMVVDYKDKKVMLDDGSFVESELLIWVSGVKAAGIKGLPEESIGPGGRILCDDHMLVKGMECVYCAGDISLTTEEKYPKGHPQMAQVAIQQGAFIARRLNAMGSSAESPSFRYRNLGSMATIGRNKAVADLGRVHLSGFPAWVIWMFIHLRSILGVRNKFVVFIDWVINYFSFKSSMKLILLKGKR